MRRKGSTRKSIDAKSYKHPESKSSTMPEVEPCNG